MTADGLVLQTRNPDDVSSEDLEQLAAEIRGTMPQTQVSVEEIATYGPGNAWVDALFVLLPTVDWLRDQAWDQVRDAIVRFMRRRFSRKYEENRPREAVIELRATGEVIMKITLRDATAEPVITDGDGG